MKNWSIVLRVYWRLDEKILIIKIYFSEQKTSRVDFLQLETQYFANKLQRFFNWKDLIHVQFTQSLQRNHSPYHP
jgi:hypothetical protein